MGMNHLTYMYTLLTINENLKNLFHKELTLAYDQPISTTEHGHLLAEIFVTFLTQPILIFSM